MCMRTLTYCNAGAESWGAFFQSLSGDNSEVWGKWAGVPLGLVKNWSL